MKKTLENDNQITLTTGWFGCDGCIARAQVKAVFDFGVLYFCGHHWIHSNTKVTELGGQIFFLNIEEKEKR